MVADCQKNASRHHDARPYPGGRVRVSIIIIITITITIIFIIIEERATVTDGRVPSLLKRTSTGASTDVNNLAHNWLNSNQSIDRAFPSPQHHAKDQKPHLVTLPRRRLLELLGGVGCLPRAAAAAATMAAARSRPRGPPRPSWSFLPPCPRGHPCPRGRSFVPSPSPLIITPALVDHSCPRVLIRDAS
jgi:hypothetical protein